MGAEPEHTRGRYEPPGNQKGSGVPLGADEEAGAAARTAVPASFKVQ